MSDVVSCKCGETEITFSGDPKFCGYCHCSDCRSAGCSAVHQGLAYPADNVNLSKGTLIECKQRETRTDYSCSKCGQTMFNSNKFGLKCLSAYNFWDAATNAVPAKFAPQLHICYAERVFDVEDGLPKYMDFPGSLLYVF